MSSSSSDQWIDTVSFLVEGVLLSIIASIGLVGNTLSFIILSTQSVQKSFHNLLLLLSIFDTVTGIHIFVSVLTNFCSAVPSHFCLPVWPTKYQQGVCGNISFTSSSCGASTGTYWHREYNISATILHCKREAVRNRRNSIY